VFCFFVNRISKSQFTRRGTNLSWPRSFPVLIAEATSNAPENQVVESLRAKFAESERELQRAPGGASRGQAGEVVRAPGMNFRAGEHLLRNLSSDTIYRFQARAGLGSEKGE
jgi:hypothetical protein